MKPCHEILMAEDSPLQGQELRIVKENYSRLCHECKSLLNKCALPQNTFKDNKKLTTDEISSVEVDKVADFQIKAIRDEPEAEMEALKREIQVLCTENKSLKEANVSLNQIILAKQEEIGKLMAQVGSLVKNIEKAPAENQELRIAKADASNKVLQETQTQYISNKNEQNLNTLQSENESLIQKMSNMALTQELWKNLQPRLCIEGEVSFAFTPREISAEVTMSKNILKAGLCCYRFGLDISKQDVTAVVNCNTSVYLYSEVTKVEEKLCTCEYYINCLAWNEQGTLLVMGGYHNNNKNDTIQVWDIPSRKIIKRLKIKNEKQICYCLSWNGDTITAGTNDYIYQWNINNPDDDQDRQGNKALLPVRTIQNRHRSHITSGQWSTCKTKFATTTENGYMCIYDKEFNLIFDIKVHVDSSSPLLQWCPWDNEVIATCCGKGYLKTWSIQQNITLIKEVKHESGIYNLKWIPCKKAIVSAHSNNQLTLWEYPGLGIIQTIKGHTGIPWYLTLNADKSAIVSKSHNEMIFWKMFNDL
mmetsp:Transcript_18644/g.33868  ORF Transcript_18644/g.33868 Transcript_18644/m.33868 type:complete len:533 (-) Transcript_18644:302-1900(-)|eukprot:CAMPEP_0175042854 /NCGR_PEP_ID=MMETSP0052_2-20121109/2821_1 /TAXON_ID=51329 ORGANISM="Polytomella parva, Strain SAG 63-3" /NCGR_SAMPLE_ID=MMETSP0052_2 /ASSEMBLY_ACC=CAM_ASM_000194 /LENGTH=532 /DNA_ID=CAMNT_0016305765 /DNA_START=396 /DNA_END=1994 /DNA_ORIENTATION=+